MGRARNHSAAVAVANFDELFGARRSSRARADRSADDLPREHIVVRLIAAAGGELRVSELDRLHAALARAALFPDLTAPEVTELIGESTRQGWVQTDGIRLSLSGSAEAEVSRYGMAVLDPERAVAESLNLRR